LDFLKDCRALAERWIRPRLSRMELMHFLDDRVRVAEDRDDVRPPERELWPDERAQVGAAVRKRQREIIMVQIIGRSLARFWLIPVRF
jgi:hypothetical protein